MLYFLYLKYIFFWVILSISYALKYNILKRKIRWEFKWWTDSLIVHLISSSSALWDHVFPVLQCIVANILDITLATFSQAARLSKNFSHSFLCLSKECGFLILFISDLIAPAPLTVSWLNFFVSIAFSSVFIQNHI